VGGTNLGTSSGKVSVATDTIKLDFPVPWSPITATRTLERPPKLLPAPDDAAAPNMIDANKVRKTLQVRRKDGEATRRGQEREDVRDYE
jgi:hypothetical protein